MAVEAAGIQSQGFESQCDDQKVQDLVLKELNAVGKKAGFKPLEVRRRSLTDCDSAKLTYRSLKMIQCVVLTHEEYVPFPCSNPDNADVGRRWTPNNGLLTAANKIQRKAIMVRQMLSPVDVQRASR